MDKIVVEQVNAALSQTPLGGHVRHFVQVRSTNDLALEAGMRGEAAGVWIADAQTAGRGRGGHSWHSAPGDGLYVSALFTPRLPVTAVPLSLVAGLAGWQAIREVSGLTVDIRWPNDLVTRPSAGEGRSKKLGGILVETSASPAQPGPANSAAMLRYAAIGIGINVAHKSFPPELASAATSLRLEGWAHPSRQELLIALLGRLSALLKQAEESHAAGRAQDVLARLPEASTWLHGKHVEVPEDGGYAGITAGLDEHGFLRVQCEDGHMRTVSSGGVREA